LSNKVNSLDISSIIKAVDDSDKVGLVDDLMSSERTNFGDTNFAAKNITEDTVSYPRSISQMGNVDYGGADYWGLTAESRESLSTNLTEALPWIFGASSGMTAGKAIPRYYQKFKNLISPSKVLPNLKGYAKKTKRPTVEGQLARGESAELFDVTTLDLPTGYDIGSLDFSPTK
jgi:hypothetical protein